MRIGSARWGMVEVGDERLFTFPDGLVGYPELTRVAVIDEGDGNTNADLVWLQSTEDPALAFSAIVPWHRFPEYEPELPHDDQVALALETEEDAMVLCLLAGDDGAGGGTANLLGPLVLNQRTGVGRQVVLFGSAWPSRAPLAA